LGRNVLLSSDVLTSCGFTNVACVSVARAFNARGNEADRLINEPGGIIPPLRQQSDNQIVQPDTLSLCKPLVQYTNYRLTEKNSFLQKRFPSSKWPKYAFAAGAPPRTPLAELTALPRTPSWVKRGGGEGREKNGKRRGNGVC